MSGPSTGGWILVSMFATILAIFLSAISTKEKSFKVFLKMMIYGVGCVIFGIATACVTGKDCLDVILLKDAGGFGRAYSAGLVLILAAILFGAIQLVRVKRI